MARKSLEVLLILKIKMVCTLQTWQLLILPAVAASDLLAISTMDISQDGNFNLQAVDKTTGTATLITKLNSTTVGGLFGGAFAHIAARDAVFTIGLDKDLDSSDLAVVSIKDGSTLGSLHFAKQLSTNTQNDPISGITYVVARDMTTLVNNVWAMNISSSGHLNLVKTMALPPKLVVELGRSAYCPVGGMLFLTTRQDDAPHGTGIIRVSLPEKKILTNEPLTEADAILSRNSTCTRSIVPSSCGLHPGYSQPSAIPVGIAACPYSEV